MHGRDHNRIYCKAVTEGQPQQALNDEEQQALIEALTGKTKNTTQTKKPSNRPVK